MPDTNTPPDGSEPVPDAVRHRHVEVTFSKAIDPDSATDVTCFLSTDSVDADGEVMLPEGCVLGRFEKNGPVMVCHDWEKKVSYYPLPVGQVLWVKKRPRGLLGGIKFARGSEMGRECKALAEEGILRGVSVGGSVIRQSPMTRAEAESRPDWLAAYEARKGRINVVREWELRELSVVPIPCNEDALIQTLKAKGLSRPGWVAPVTVTAKEAPMIQDETATEPETETPEAPTPEPEVTPAETSTDETVKALPAPDEADEDEDEEDAPVRNGHFVKVIKGPYKGVAGKVRSVHRGGPVPDVDDDVMATKSDPAARVQCYKSMGEGYAETPHHVGVKVAHLEKTDDLKPPKKKKGVDAPAPLPPIAGRSDAQVAAERLREVRKALRPEAVAALVRAEEDRAMGAV